MSKRKISYHDANKLALEALCNLNDYDITWLNEYQARVITGVVIVDFWTPRMKYNVLNIDGVEQPSKFDELDYQFNVDQVTELLNTGRLSPEHKFALSKRLK